MMTDIRRNALRLLRPTAQYNQEVAILRSQTVTPSWGGRRSIPCAFTEQGVAMLSSVLKSPKAIAVNIEIMRAFVRLRRLIASNKKLARRLEELEASTDTRFRQVFEAIRQLMAPPNPPKRPIGFVTLKERGETGRSAK